VLLQLDQRVGVQKLQQRFELLPPQGEGPQRFPDLGQGLQQLILRIAQQCRKNAVDHHSVVSVSRGRTVGPLRRDKGISWKMALPCGLRPNRVPSDTPPEQPLPKVKPQLPFSLKASSASSLWLLGTTKRSS